MSNNSRNDDNANKVCQPRDSFLYSKLDNNEAAQLEALSRHSLYESESCLFLQRSEATHVYTIVSGTLLVERLSSMGQRQVLAFLFPGDFLGFTHNPYFEFSLHTLTATEVATYPRKRFLSLSNETPQLKQNIEQISSNVLASALDQVFALGQKKAHERLCFFLKQLLKRQPGASLNNILVEMTRRDIGDYLGLTIETVSRAFSQLKKENIIVIKNAIEISIIDPALFEQYADSD